MQLEKTQTNGVAKAPLQHVAWRVTPELDLYESGNEYLIQLDVPGASAESVNVQVVGTRVFVRAEQATSTPASSAEGTEQPPIALAAFERQLDLPSDVDPNSASAELKNGVLEIRIAKSASARRVKIPVNAN
jgi:HSP20 family protein